VTRIRFPAGVLPVLAALTLLWPLPSLADPPAGWSFLPFDEALQAARQHLLGLLLELFLAAIDML